MQELYICQAMKIIDLPGTALKDFYYSGDCSDIIVHSNIFEDELMPVELFFRDFREMPKIEKIALKYCRGKVLDIGAGAGSHSLYLQNKKMDVTALDISQGAYEVMKARGIKNVLNADLFAVKNQKFDTLLMLMNGIGICGTIKKFKKFLSKAHELLKPDGIILFDSSDIKHHFMEKDGSMWINLGTEYYGEVEFQMEYRETKGKTFPWLFIDFETAEKISNEQGFECTLLYSNKNHQYLAMLKQHK